MSNETHHTHEFAIDLANQQSTHAVNEAQLVAAVESVLRDSAFASAEVSLAVVDDAEMHALNRRFLNHDYPTDVLSFTLEDEGDHLVGEIILSADTAAASAAEVGWPAAAEQLLYVIHGALHLTGYDDTSDAAALEMRAAEARYLHEFGFTQPAGREGQVSL